MSMPMKMPYYAKPHKEQMCSFTYEYIILIYLPTSKYIHYQIVNVSTIVCAANKLTMCVRSQRTYAHTHIRIRTTPEQTAAVAK